MFKRLLSDTERETHARLDLACARNSAVVFAKMRMADVLPIESSGISGELFRFALQSHFDFTVADSRHMPLFAVEFDGPMHADIVQVDRDRKKDALCERFGFPLLRISIPFLRNKYRDLDLLTWFVEVWFASKAFDEAQAAGQVPPYEPFDPFSVVSISGLGGSFPLWLSAEPRVKLQRLCQQGECLSYIPSIVIGTDEDGYYHGMAFMQIDQRGGVLVSARMKGQIFCVPVADALAEILPFLVYDKAIAVLKGNDVPKTRDEIAAAVDGFRKYVSVCSATIAD